MYRPGLTVILQYERALSFADGKVEIRYAIRPLARIQIDSDAHGTTPEPDHLLPLMYQALTSQLSRSGHVPSNEYSSVQVRSD